MRRYNQTLLAARALWRLMAFDALLALRGFRAVYASMNRGISCGRVGETELEDAVCRAVTRVSSFYFKPVRCLQRSATIAGVLRSYGIDAHVVIGYKPAPLFSHAWVEVGGRVVGGSPANGRMLCPLTRI